MNKKSIFSCIAGIVLAAIIASLLVMIVEVFCINGHVSEWKAIELKHEIAKGNFPIQYYASHENSAPMPAGNMTVNDIDKIEAFYDRRFVTLLWTMGIMVTLAGIILPIVLTIIQQGSIKDERQEIANRIEQLNSYKNQIDEFIKKNNQKYKELYKNFYRINARNYHGFAESWFRQYQELGEGISGIGTAIVYCDIAINYNYCG